jgi:hypothetical protein
MRSMNRLLGFRSTCTLVGVLQIMLACSILLRGARTAMAPFGVPDVVLSSPHYQDAITWVYVHMAVLGALIATAGSVVVDPRKQVLFCRVLCAAHLLYLFMDVRTAESFLGNGLYRGAASNIPTFIGLFFCVLFARLSVAPKAPGTTAGSA